MAVLRDFCDLYRISQSAHSSPRRSSKLPQSRLRSGEHRFLSDESKGSKQFRTYTSSDHMLGLHQETPRGFPRYTRLPAIGTIHEQGYYKPKLMRQKTYTVINPIYVKGPKEPPIKSNLKKPLVEPLQIPQKPFLKTKRLLPSRGRAQQNQIAQEHLERKGQIPGRFSTRVNGESLLMNEELVEATKKLEIDVSLREKRAFWVQF